MNAELKQVLEKATPTVVVGHKGQSQDYVLVTRDGRQIVLGDAIYGEPHFANLVSFAINSLESHIQLIGAMRELLRKIQRGMIAEDNTAEYDWHSRDIDAIDSVLAKVEEARL